MRVVPDTNVVVAALLWDGNPRRLMEFMRGGKIRFFTSRPLLAELTDVLSRPKFATKIAASQLSVDQLVDLYAALVAVVKPVAMPRIAPDPDDDIVIGTALAAKSGFLVTGDHSLLSVGEYESVRIVSVSEALQIVEP